MLKSITTISVILMTLASLSLRGQDTLSIYMSDQIISDESQVIVPFSVRHFKSISYFSFSVNWDPSRFDFNAIVYQRNSGLSEEDFHTSLVKAGEMGMQWIDPLAQASSLRDSVVIFNLILDLKDDTKDLAEINFTNDPTGIEAGDVNGVEIPLNSSGAKISFEQQSTSIDQLQERELKLYQNIPNPFTSTTTISFELIRTEEVVFKVFDVNGQNLIRQQSVFPQGLNTIELNKLQFGGSGVYEYSLSIKQKTISKKLILIEE